MSPAHAARDHAFMARALSLAARGLNGCDPNPRVGCIVVRDGNIVGEGWHQRAGEPHAEVLALAGAGERARGGTAYVTLEPCCHHGRTPPCTDALIEAGVRRVVAAMEDPDERVAGKGLARLARVGIDVNSGCLEADARMLNRGFVQRHALGRPFVRVKLAASLDGATAMADGESQWITGVAARRDVHRRRAGASAIVTGIGTVLLDDPSLTVRAEGLEAPWRQPLRAVVDTQLRMPADARMLGEPGQTLIFHAAQDPARVRALEAAGARLERLPASARGVDLRAALAHLAAGGANEVLVEAGATLSGALLEADVVDEIVLYLAPHLMGRNTRGLFELPAVTAMAGRRPVEVREARMVGADLRITAVPV